jgi:hypothetical protein
MADTLAEAGSRIFHNVGDLYVTDDLPPLENGPIAREEVETALRRMKGGTAPGADGLHVETLKRLAKDGKEPWKKFVDYMLRQVNGTGSIGASWGVTLFVRVPKPKTGFRTIALETAMQRILAKVMVTRLHAVKLLPQQFGFFPRRSATQAILSLRLDIDKARKAGQRIHMVFLDL